MRILKNDLEKLKSIEIESSTSEYLSCVGICSKVCCDLTPYFRTWKHFSGDYMYPVPSCDDERTPREKYDSTGNMFNTQTKYGRMRLDLLKHIINAMEKQIDSLNQFNMREEYFSLLGFLNNHLPRNREILVKKIYSAFLRKDDDTLLVSTLHNSKFALSRNHGVCYALENAFGVENELDLNRLFEFMGYMDLNTYYPIESSDIYNKSDSKWDSIERIENRVNFLYEIRATLHNISAYE